MQGFANLSIALFEGHSQFLTLKDAVDNAMLTSLGVSTSHGDYFAACAPSECVYYQWEKPTVIELITIILGLIGGLSVVSTTIAVKLATSSIVNKWCWRRTGEPKLLAGDLPEELPTKKRGSTSASNTNTPVSVLNPMLQGESI
jgi:hypothetical protein